MLIEAVFPLLFSLYQALTQKALNDLRRIFSVFDTALAPTATICNSPLHRSLPSLQKFIQAFLYLPVDSRTFRNAIFLGGTFDIGEAKAFHDKQTYQLYNPQKKEGQNIPVPPLSLVSCRPTSRRRRSTGISQSVLRYIKRPDSTPATPRTDAPTEWRDVSRHHR